MPALTEHDLAGKRRGRFFGPGLITGAADDDPSGIATYSQAGATAGLGLLWTSLFTLPLMIAVQLMCARLGMVAGQGFAGVMRRFYPRWLLWLACALLIAANVVNIGADLNGMAAVLELLTGVPGRHTIVPIAVGLLALMVFASYEQLARVLRWLTMALLAYVITAVIATPSWSEVLVATVTPSIPRSREELLLVVALFGTTISPYLFFWEAAEEVEEEMAMGRVTVASRMGASDRELRDARVDVASGMTFSNLVAFFIILTTGATLHRAGVRDVQSAAQAADALRPLAGNAAGLLFAVGVFATGLLAIPVLAGSAAYALADAAGWRASMTDRPSKAPTFYAVLALMVFAGAALNVSSMSAMRMLVLAAVVNGILAPPLIILLLMMCNDRRVMGDHTNGVWLNLLGLVLAVVMGGAALMILKQ